MPPSAMPAFAAAWTDEEIARFGAKPSSITIRQVRELRET